MRLNCEWINIEFIILFILSNSIAQINPTINKTANEYIFECTNAKKIELNIIENKTPIPF